MRGACQRPPTPYASPWFSKTSPSTGQSSALCCVKLMPQQECIEVTSMIAADNKNGNLVVCDRKNNRILCIKAAAASSEPKASMRNPV